jgi:hypothetical protein
LGIQSLQISPCYFLFESSHSFMLQLSPLSSLFEPSPTPSVPKYKSFQRFKYRLHKEQNEWIYTLKYVYIHPYVVHIEISKKNLYLGIEGVYSTAWSSFTSNNTKNLGGFGRADRSRKRSTCSHVGSWDSRARPLSKELIPEGRRDVARSAAGGRICPQYGREEEGVRGPPRAGAVSERMSRAEDQDPPTAVGFLPHRRWPRVWST